MLGEYVKAADGLGAEWDSHEVGITSGIPYVEAQVWGGVTLDDIESVTFESMGFADLARARELAAQGIKVFVGPQEITNDPEISGDDSL